MVLTNIRRFVVLAALPKLSDWSCDVMLQSSKGKRTLPKRHKNGAVWRPVAIHNFCYWLPRVIFPPKSSQKNVKLYLFRMSLWVFCSVLAVIESRISETKTCRKNTPAWKKKKKIASTPFQTKLVFASRDYCAIVAPQQCFNIPNTNISPRTAHSVSFEYYMLVLRTSNVRGGGGEEPSGRVPKKKVLNRDLVQNQLKLASVGISRINIHRFDQS